MPKSQLTGASAATFDDLSETKDDRAVAAHSTAVGEGGSKTMRRLPGCAGLGGMTRFFAWAADRPLLVGSAILALQTLPTLWAKDLWFIDEVRHAAVLRQLLEDGHWLVLYLGDAPYPDKPPLYFWTLAGFARLFGSDEPPIFMLIAALSAWIFLVATVFAARTWGLSGRATLLTVLVLLSDYFFVERAHHPRMDLLFAAFIVFAHAGFFRAVADRARVDAGWAVFAACMCALAVLTKGPLGAILPVGSLVVWLARERRPGDLTSRAIVIAALLLCGVMTFYLAGVVIVGGWSFAHAILIDQIWQRAVDAPRLSAPLYFYAYKLPELMLPWSILLFFLPWRRLGTRAFWSRVWTPGAQGRSTAGLGYAWCSAVTSFVLISAIDYKISFLLLTVFPQAAILTGAYIDRMSASRREWLFLAVAGALLLAAAAFPFGYLLSEWPASVRGGSLVAGIAALLSVVLFRLRRASPDVFAFAFAAGMTAMALPYYLVTVRGLDEIMSPRRQAILLSEGAKEGYAVFFHPPHRDRIGMYDYHAHIDIRHVMQLDGVAEVVATEPRGMLALTSRTLREWPNRPLGLEPVDERQIDAEEYSIVRWERTAEEP